MFIVNITSVSLKSFFEMLFLFSKSGKLCVGCFSLKLLRKSRALNIITPMVIVKGFLASCHRGEFLGSSFRSAYQSQNSSPCYWFDLNIFYFNFFHEQGLGISFYNIICASPYSLFYSVAFMVDAACQTALILSTWVADVVSMRPFFLHRATLIVCETVTVNKISALTFLSHFPFASGTDGIGSTAWVVLETRVMYSVSPYLMSNTYIYIFGNWKILGVWACHSGDAFSGTWSFLWFPGSLNVHHITPLL